MSTRLPQTDSIRQLAEFWDTHDLTDFEDELKEVNERVFERKARIPVHLEPQDAEAVRRMAQACGVSESELLREWALEKIHGT
jgi:predicted DNA binding CopG/RHH family protein